MSFIEYQGGRMKAILAIVCMVGARKPERERERERYSAKDGLQKSVYGFRAPFIACLQHCMGGNAI